MRRKGIGLWIEIGELIMKTIQREQIQDFRTVFPNQFGGIENHTFSKLFKSIQTTCVLQEAYFSKKNSTLSLLRKPTK